MSGQDKMIGILKRLDDERTFTNVWMERFEKELGTVKELDLVGIFYLMFFHDNPSRLLVYPRFLTNSRQPSPRQMVGE